ncbi:hypothetical protein SFRURICE_015053 [Spodoptera frugiperda]|nr:hypothetical protein SFRURICE_015053 [Spodoptera frugiperda]
MTNCPIVDQQLNLELTSQIKCVKQFIEKHKNLFDLEKIDQTRSVPLDVTNLLNDTEFISSWPNFNTELFEYPDNTLRLLEYCLHETLKCESKIKVRILNHQPVIPLANLKVNYFGKLVTIKGTVIRVGSVGLICTSMAFECSSCHNLQAVIQPQGVFTAPTSCQSCNGGSKFEPLQSSPFTNTTDWQVAKIQEIQSQSLSGTIPRSVEIELQGDLVGAACPGDVLSVTGIVQEIHATEDVFRLLVHSLCPTIFGHEAVKAGLILGLIGGTEHDNGPRSNPHVLVVGDPGLGKSQLLQAAAHAAPRGVYVCGASASAGGLTVALGREAGGDFALEAGALVLADKGVCCIDELDKASMGSCNMLQMTAHHSSLLEAMEQRRVSVAKGGVVCSLAARATVLAAANPAGGSYNSQRLRLKPGEVIDHLPLVLLRKYIAYARRYVHPKLSTEAANALQNFYLELRHNHQGGSHDGTPITTRQLEACIRLTQARARVDLREEATVKDANDVISLLKHSLIDTFSDEFGNIQLSRSINGSGLKKFLDALTRRSHQLGKDIFTRQEMIQIHKAAGVAGDPNDLIEAMHTHSYLLLKGSNTYQLITI